jgi:3-hydroxyisobutyrate dehydrogenase
MNDADLINQIPNNLEDILQDCWHRLIDGAVSSRHPFHCSPIATINGEFPKSRLQLRIKTISAIHHDDQLSLKSWNESTLDSKKCYLVQAAPSTLADYPSDGLPEHINHSSLNEEIVAIGIENFAVIRNLVTEIDWLFLNHDGHRRAKFIFGENEVEKYWMIP